MALYCTGALQEFEMALYSSVLQRSCILALCVLIFLAEQCTAMYGSVLHWSLTGV